MTGISALLLKPALDAALAGTAAKGAMDMNKKKEDFKILDDGTKTSKKPVEKKEKTKEPEYRTLSESEIDDLMIMLVEGGLSTREAKQIAKTGYITKEQLAKLPPDINRRLTKLTGIGYNELLAGAGAAPDPNDDDETKKKKEKIKEKIDKQIEESKKSVKNYEKGEAEFHKTDSKTKKLNEAQNYQKGWNEAYLSKENQLLRNSPEQKAEKIAEQMKEAAKHGRLKEWEYNNVSPTANTPVRP